MLGSFLFLLEPAESSLEGRDDLIALLTQEPQLSAGNSLRRLTTIDTDKESCLETQSVTVHLTVTTLRTEHLPYYSSIELLDLVSVV